MNYSQHAQTTIFGLVLLSGVATNVYAAQLSYSVIYRSPAPDNAAQPPLTAAKTGGALYATTESGGAFGHGSVISLTSPQGGGSWLVSTLYSFTGGADGLAPNAGLALAPDGSLYGTTLGTVFRVAPPTVAGNPWTEQVIYKFNSPNLGTGNLVIDPAGNLYGTVESNPQQPNPLAIFRLTAPAASGGAWVGNRIYNFSSANEVQGGLVVTSKGVVISTIADNVIALKVSADGLTTTVVPIYNLASFGLLTNAPALVTSSGSILLPVTGSTQYGQIIALQPPSVAGNAWTESVLFAFDGAIGSYPQGALGLGKDGTIYGTTYGGGTQQYGTVYQLTPPEAAGGAWTDRILHSFLGNQLGQEPDSGVIVSGSGIFGLAGISGDNLNVLGFEITSAQ